MSNAKILSKIPSDLANTANGNLLTVENGEIVWKQNYAWDAANTANNYLDNVKYDKSGGTISGNVNITGNTSYTGTLIGGTGIVNIGSGQIYKDAGGNLGIGTSSPSYRLDVVSVGSANSETCLHINNPYYSGANVASASMLFSYHTGEAKRGAAKIEAGQQVNGTFSFGYLSFSTQSGDSTLTERLRIDSSGNVGIGTSSPVNLIDAYGDGKRIASRSSTASGLTMIEAQVSDYWSGSTYKGTSIQQHGSTATGTSSGLSNANLGILSFQNTSAGLVYTNAGAPLVFGTLNTERMRIDFSGNVGIGTDSPQTKLHLRTTSGTALALRIGNSASYAEFQVDASGYSQLISPGGVQIFNTNGSERMRINSSGNVGVGTDSPGYKLDVAGQIKSNTSVVVTDGTDVMTLSKSALSLTSSANNAFLFSKPYYGRYDTTVGGLGNPFWQGFHWAPPDVIGISGNNYFPRVSQYWDYSTTTNPSEITFCYYASNYPGANTMSLFFGTEGPGNIRFASNGTERMRINTSGNVGIGTSNPGYKLDVNGTSRFSDTITLPNRFADGGSSAYWGSLLYAQTLSTRAMSISSSSDGGFYAGSNCYLATNAASTWNRGDTNISAARLSLNYDCSLRVQAASSGTNPISSWTDRFVIDSSGRVGIGASSPGYALEVHKQITIKGNNPSGNTEYQDWPDCSFNIRRSDDFVSNGITMASFGYRSDPTYFTDSRVCNIRIWDTTQAASASTSASTTKMTLGSPGAFSIITGNSAEKLFIDSSGRVGIGITNLNDATTSGLGVLGTLGVGVAGIVGYKAAVYSGTSLGINNNLLLTPEYGGLGRDSAIIFGATFNNNWGGVDYSPRYSGAIQYGASNGVYGEPRAWAMRFLVGAGDTPTERMRIDYNGNLGLGVTPSGWNSGNAALQSPYGWIVGTGQINLGYNIYYNSGDKYAQNGYAALIRASTAGGGISFNLAGNNTSGAGASAVLSAAMTLTTAGDLVVGDTSAIANGRLTVRKPSGNYNTVVAFQPDAGGYNFYSYAANNGGTYYHAYFGAGASQVGSITSNGTNTAYNQSSDYRLKENVQPIQNALSRVALLKPSTYNWKTDGSDGEGFIAHELQEVVPQAVSGEKDGEQMQGVDYGKLTPLLAAAIQELHAEIESLKAKVH